MKNDSVPLMTSPGVLEGCSSVPPEAPLLPRGNSSVCSQASFQSLQLQTFSSPQNYVVTSHFFCIELFVLQMLKIKVWCRLRSETAYKTTALNHHCIKLLFGDQKSHYTACILGLCNPLAPRLRSGK